MNSQQLKYARERAGAIYKSLTKKECDRAKEASVSLAFEERLAELSAGRFKIRDPESGYRLSLEDWIIFDRERPVNQTELKARLALIEAKYNALLDELMLGDEKIALNLIKAFEALE